MSVSDLVMSNKECLRKYDRAFRIYFQEIMHTYMNFITGFDIVRFDENVVCPGENESCHDAIVRQFGNVAAVMIAQILQYPKIKD